MKIRSSMHKSILFFSIFISISILFGCDRGTYRYVGQAGNVYIYEIDGKKKIFTSEEDLRLALEAREEIPWERQITPEPKLVVKETVVKYEDLDDEAKKAFDSYQSMKDMSAGDCFMIRAQGKKKFHGPYRIIESNETHLTTEKMFGNGWGNFEIFTRAKTETKEDYKKIGISKQIECPDGPVHKWNAGDCVIRSYWRGNLAGYFYIAEVDTTIRQYKGINYYAVDSEVYRYDYWNFDTIDSRKNSKKVECPLYVTKLPYPKPKEEKKDGQD